MTIAVGILTPKGIVIAADSQESYTHAKVEGDKIMVLTSQRSETQGVIAVTGAGDAGYLDKCAQNYLAAYLGCHKAELLKKNLETTLEAFYQTHVLPFGREWVEQSSLAISTIVGYQRGETTKLLASSLTAMRDAGPYVAMGTGETVARGVLRDLYREGMTLESSARLAALSVYRAKDHDPYCGKRTDVAVLHKGRYHKVHDQTVTNWERQFDAIAELNAITSRRALEIPTLPHESHDLSVRCEFIRRSWSGSATKWERVMLMPSALPPNPEEKPTRPRPRRGRKVRLPSPE